MQLTICVDNNFFASDLYPPVLVFWRLDV